jgi:hypothetical protein
MPDYLLDTNHVIHLLNGLENLRQRIQVAEDTQRFRISMTVLGELYYNGFLKFPRLIGYQRLIPLPNHRLRGQLVGYAGRGGRLDLERKILFK